MFSECSYKVVSFRLYVQFNVSRNLRTLLDVIFRKSFEYCCHIDLNAKLKHLSLFFVSGILMSHMGQAVDCLFIYLFMCGLLSTPSVAQCQGD
jgi:hypothetical protein